MERCEHCSYPDVRHDDCVGLVGGWCECPCHTGEVGDPVKRQETVSDD